jgi:hypothetical protein
MSKGSGGISSVSGLVGDVRSIAGAARLDEVGSTLYFGQAFVGALDAASVWQIQRITFPTPGQDDMVIEWADGNIRSDNVWNDRLGLSYS